MYHWPRSQPSQSRTTPPPAYELTPPGYTEDPQQMKSMADSSPASSKGRWIAKVVLRLVSVLCCVVIITFCAGLSQESDFDFTGLVFLGPPASAAIAWCLVESACIWRRRGHTGIHPGICVAVDLCLWLGLVAASVAESMLLPVPSHVSPNGRLLIWEKYGETVSPYPILIFGFGVAAAVVHFVLFAIACCETNVRNRRRRVLFY